MTAPSPGEVLKQRILKLGLTQDQFAKMLDIHFVTISRIIKGHEPFSPQWAMIFAKAFSTTPQYWLHLLADWELEQHKKKMVTTSMGKQQAKIIARVRVFE